MTRLLVVEDFADTREMLVMTFENAGYEVFAAADGVEGVAMARTCRPAVIVMDIYMPKMDGIEATRRIKASQGLERVPVLAYTAKPTPVERDLFAAICTKPCSPDRLLDLVAKVASGTPIRVGES